MTPAPDTGRTADENEMREQIRRAIKLRWDLLTGPAQDAGNVIAGAWRRKDLCAEFADIILAGPLAQLQADLIAAREERDEAQRQVSEAVLEVDPPLKDGVWCGTLTEAIAATNEALDAAEAEIAHLRAENANLRDRVREAEKGAEAMIPTPEMIAAAWDAWSPRHKPHNKLGPGPAFREAIQAALAAKAAPLPDGDTGGKGAA